MRVAAFRFLFPLAVLFLLPVLAFGQQASGNIEGIVKDNSGAVIAGAEVTVTSADTGFTRTLQTDSAGYYRFPSLEVGRYNLKIMAQGFAPTEQTGVLVQVGKSVTIDVAMQVGSVSTEVVTVTAEAPVVETTRTQVSSSVDERSVRDLPVNGRNFQEFILLTPGVNKDPRLGDISFGGLRGTNNSLQIDGSDNNNNFFGQALGRTGSGRAPYQFSKDAVREFQVNTNSYAAEYGRAGGAVVNVVTKSGTNDFHGGGFLFFRDRSLNAEEPFAKALGRPKPRNRFYQFGAILSGPIKKDKAFFFFNYDGQRNSEPNPVFISSAIPTDPVSQAVFRSLTPFFTTYQREFKQDVFLGKVDIQLSPGNRLSTRYNHQKFDGTNLENSGNGSALEHTGNSNVETDTAVANLTSVLTPKLVNDLRFQFSRDDEPGAANSDNPEAVIIVGSSTFNIGRNNFSPRFTNIKRFQIIDGITYTVGTHAFKFGADFNIERIKNFFPGLFSGSYTFLSLADFADGKPSGGYRQSFPGSGTSGALTNPDIYEISVYAQDDWRVNPRFKLYYGIRYDYQKLKEPKITNPNDQLSLNNIDTGKVNQDLNNFGPRVGAAYTLTKDNKTVLRLGYGIFYSRTPAILSGTVLSQNGVQVIALSFSGSAVPTYPFKFSAPPSGATPSKPSILYYDQNYVSPLIQQGSVGIERELPGGIGVTVSYLVVKGTHLQRLRDINLGTPVPTFVPISTGGGVVVDKFPAVRPFGAFNRIEVVASDANSIYNGLSFQINKRFSYNFQFLASYTFSKAIDDKPDATAVVFGTDDPKLIQNPLRPDLDRARGDSDVKHRFTLSGVYDLNLTRTFNLSNSSGVAKAILDGYSFSGIFTATSGVPFNVSIPTDLNGDGNSRTDRVPGVGRNTIETPNFYRVDLRLSKSFRPTEKTKIEFIGEAFNLFNRVNIVGIDNARFNFVSGVLVPNARFMAPTQSTGNATGGPGANRQFQLAVKFDF